MKKNIKFIFCFCRSLSGWSIKYILLSGLLLQSCAITKTETKIVPGKELSKTSIGLREIENKNIIKEITPYSVGIFRKVCDAELFHVEYKGVSESVHQRQELYCASAYIEYVAIQITTLGLHFLYDSVTGFGDFSGMCNKGPLKISNDTRETNAIVSQEMIEFNNAICRDVPVSNAEVTVEIDNNISKITSSVTGIAALGPELMAAVENLKRDVFVNYRYMGETIKTNIKQYAGPVIQAVKADNQNTTKMSVEDVDKSATKVGETVKFNTDLMRGAQSESQAKIKVYDQAASVKNKLSQEQLEDEAYKLTLAVLGRYKGELPNIPVEGEKKPAQVSFMVEFDFNESDVNEESIGELKRFLEIMKNNPNVVCVVDGHTDDLGSARLSNKMSLQRASAMKDIFVNRYGIAAKRIQVYGHGSTKPIANIDSAEGSAKNRRIEIRTVEATTGL